MTLRQTALVAGRWTAISAGTRAALQLAQVMILARVLAPSDFGLMALAAASLTIVTLVSDLGLNRALIYFDQVGEEALASLYWTTVLAGFALSALLAASAPAQAMLFDQPALLPVLLAISPAVFISALGQQFCVLAEKNLQFRVLAQNEIAATSAGVAVGLVLAYLGFGVFALVASLLATSTIGSLLAIWRLADWRLPQRYLSFAGVRPYLTYGLYPVGENFTGTLNRQADIFIGGLIAGPTDLAFFSLPRDLCFRLGMLVNPIITRVGFPVMSQVRDDRESLKTVYKETVRFTASINLPVYMGLAFFAGDLVRVLYGPGWSEAADLLLSLALWGMMRSIVNPVGSLLHGIGRARLSFWWNIGLLVIYPPFLLLFAWLDGLQGLAHGLVILQFAIMVASWLLLVRPACGLSFAELLGAVAAPSVLAAASAALSSLATNSLHTPVARLAAGGCLMAGIYWLTSLRFNARWTSVIMDAAPFFRSRRTTRWLP